MRSRPDVAGNCVGPRGIRPARRFREGSALEQPRSLLRCGGGGDAADSGGAGEAKCTEKRGGGRRRVDLDRVQPQVTGTENLLALDEALEQLEAKDPRKAQLVKLKYFAGLTNAQTAEVLGVSASTVDSDWAYARCWLRLKMTEGG